MSSVSGSYLRYEQKQKDLLENGKKIKEKE